MDRSHMHLLARMTLGLIICIVLWTALREQRDSSSAVSLEAVAVAAQDPASSAAPREQKNSSTAASDQTSSDKADAAIESGQPTEKVRASKKDQDMETATFGGGCFWCVEAVLQRVAGVEKVVSGYAGGDIKAPTYEQVCTGTTGHAEVVQVTFDPKQLSYVKLLEVFMKTHDPTTLNQQGHDVGTQYRSIILTHSDEQAKQAKEVLEKLDAAHIFSDPIVTEIKPMTAFYPAEEGHQNYFNRNPSSRYCQVVVRSKVEKLEKFFRDLMKPDAE